MAGLGQTVAALVERTLLSAAFGVVFVFVVSEKSKAADRSVRPAIPPVPFTFNTLAPYNPPQHR